MKSLMNWVKLYNVKFDLWYFNKYDFVCPWRISMYAYVDFII